MIPESLATLYAFLALVAPGLVYQLVRERVRPTIRETAFREASRVALTSLIFTTASILTLALIGRLAPQLVVDVNAWATSEDYVADHLWLAASSIFAEVTLASGLAAASAKFVGKRDGKARRSIEKHGVRHQLFKGGVPADSAAWVLAELIDGTRVWGFVHYYTIDEGLDQRDISFSGPGLIVQKDRDSEKKEEEYWKHVVIKGSDIVSMKVAYEKISNSA
ncbi:MAG TPA: DUF6338 family protein [Jiangellaceae bacterium]